MTLRVFFDMKTADGGPLGRIIMKLGPDDSRRLVSMKEVITVIDEHDISKHSKLRRSWRMMSFLRLPRTFVLYVQGRKESGSRVVPSIKLSQNLCWTSQLATSRGSKTKTST